MSHGTVRAIVGYRLLESHEILQKGDVAGWSKKVELLESWFGQKASQFNQPVFRPMSAFTDYVQKVGLKRATDVMDRGDDYDCLCPREGGDGYD